MVALSVTRLELHVLREKVRDINRQIRVLTDPGHGEHLEQREVEVLKGITFVVGEMEATVSELIKSWRARVHSV